MLNVQQTAQVVTALSVHFIAASRLRIILLRLRLSLSCLLDELLAWWISWQ
jgi:hypothetical protein